MRPGNAALLLSLLVAGCNPSLKTPPGAEIACTTDQECPGTLKCQLRTQLCVAADVNLDIPPNITALAMSPGRLGRAVGLTFTLADPDADPTTDVVLQFEFSLDGATFAPATLVSGGAMASFSASQVGESHAVVWDAIADATLGAGGLSTLVGYDSGGTLQVNALVAPTSVTVRATVQGTSISDTTDSFTIGSNLPSLLSPLSTGSTAQIPISVELSDDETDPVDLEYEFSTDPLSPSATWSAARIALGATTAISTTTADTPHLVLWDSAFVADPLPAVPQGVGATAPPEVGVRIRARESLDDGAITYTDWVYTPVFSILNQRAPRIGSIVSPRSLSQSGAGIVPVRFNLSDEERDPVDVAFAYSNDDGVTWVPAREYPSALSGGSTQLVTRTLDEGGVNHVWVWDATGLGLEVAATTQLRLRATDGLNAAVAEEVFLLGGATSVQVPVSSYAWIPSGDLGLTDVADFSLADVDADGALDLLVVSSSAAELQIWTGNRVDKGADGTFSGPSAVALSAVGDSVAVGDFEQDGFPDVLVTSGADIFILRNTSGVLSATETLTAGAIIAASGRARLEDVSGDGWPDPSVVSSAYVDGTKVEYWPAQTSGGVPTGGFASSATLDVPSAAPMNIDFDVDDVDGDTINDVVVAGGLVRVFYGTPSGPEPSSTLAAATGGSVVLLASLDDDPQAEIIVADQFGSEVVVADLLPVGWASKGYGFGFPRNVAAADANRDGFLDVIAFEGNANTARVFQNLGADTLEFSSGELWLDGMGDLARVVVGDLNADGSVDLINGQGLIFTQSITAPLSDQHYDSASALPVGSDPRSLDTGHLDCRPGLDAVVVSWGEGKARTLANGALGLLPTGRFQVSEAYGVFTQPYSTALGDVNGDGVVDLAVASELTSLVAVHLGVAEQGCGTGEFGPLFQSFRTIPVAVPAGRARGIRLRDFDGDGVLDIVVVNLEDVVSEVVVFINDGTGMFSEAHRETTAYTEPIAVEVGDFDRDGRNDLAVATQEFPTSGISVHLQNMSGTLDPPTNYDANFFGIPGDIAAVDLNDDQILDLVVPLTATDTVQVFWGNENVVMDGVFTLGTAYPAGDFPFSIQVLDADLDGLADVATADLGGDSVTVLRGSDTATRFGLPNTYADFPDARGLRARDFTGDGLPDILATRAADGRVQLLQSRFEAYNTWSRRLGTREVAPVGFAPLDSVDALGQRVLDRIILRYEPSTVGDVNSRFGVQAEAALVLARQAKPLTQAFRVEGTHRTTRADVMGALAWRIQPRLAGGGGLGWTNGRGLEIRWPLLPTRTIADLQNMVLVKRTESLRNASTWAGDPLDGVGAAEQEYLPCRDALCADPVVQVETAWSQMSLTDLATLQSTEANGAAVDSATWELVIRTDVGATFQLFSEP